MAMIKSGKEAVPQRAKYTLPHLHYNSAAIVKIPIHCGTPYTVCHVYSALCHV